MFFLRPSGSGSKKGSPFGCLYKPGWARDGRNTSPSAGGPHKILLKNEKTFH
jgi:hypothetical protein